MASCARDHRAFAEWLCSPAVHEPSMSDDEPWPAGMARHAPGPRPGRVSVVHADKPVRVRVRVRVRERFAMGAWGMDAWAWARGHGRGCVHGRVHARVHTPRWKATEHTRGQAATSTSAGGRTTTCTGTAARLSLTVLTRKACGSTTSLWARAASLRLLRVGAALVQRHVASGGASV